MADEAKALHSVVSRRNRTFYLTYMIQKASGPSLCSCEWKVRTYTGRPTSSLHRLASAFLTEKHGLSPHRISILGLKEL